MERLNNFLQRWDWWYYHVDGYDLDLRVLQCFLKDNMEFEYANALQYAFPRIIKKVEQDADGKVKLVFYI